MSKLPNTFTTLPSSMASFVTTSNKSPAATAASLALPSALPSSVPNSAPSVLPSTLAACNGGGFGSPASLDSANGSLVHSSQSQRAKMQNVPAFLNKLFNMVDDPSSDDLICWADDGLSFIVLKHEEFAKRVLPRFFKHSNFSSFVRQLNMYGFHKVPHLQQGVLHADTETERWEFSNPNFQRNHPDLLLLVTRKKGRDPEEKEPGNIDLHHILDEISAIKKHQMSISADLKSIQQDNQVLWQETLSARERHQRHQETIDKILRFLASVFSSDKKRVVIPRKRRFLIGDANTEYKEEDLEEEEEEEEVAEDDGRPSKKSRSSVKFDIGEYVHDDDESTAEDMYPSAGLTDTTSQGHAPATELAAAIALNDQTKQAQNATLGQQPAQGALSAQQPDLSSMFSLQQLQGLQNMIALAQANPALLSQLANDPIYTPDVQVPPNFGNLGFDLGSASGIPALGAPEPSRLSPLDSGTSTPSQQPLSPSQPLLGQALATQTPPTTTPNDSNNNNTKTPPPTLSQVTDTIASATKTADAITHDIDALGNSIGALAAQLGFDPSLYTAPQ